MSSAQAAIVAGVVALGCGLAIGSAFRFSWRAARTVAALPPWSPRAAPWTTSAAVGVVLVGAVVIVGHVTGLRAGLWTNAAFVFVAGAPVLPLAMKTLTLWRTVQRHRGRTRGRVRTLRGRLRASGTMVNGPVSGTPAIAVTAEVWIAHRPTADARISGRKVVSETRASPGTLETRDGTFQVDFQTAHIVAAEIEMRTPAVDSPMLTPAVARQLERSHRGRPSGPSRCLYVERALRDGDEVEVLVDVEGTDAQAITVVSGGARFGTAVAYAWAGFVLGFVAAIVATESVRRT